MTDVLYALLALCVVAGIAIGAQLLRWFCGGDPLDWEE